MKNRAVSEIYDLLIEWNGWKYTTIFGKSIDGWFIAIPNWKICKEFAHPNDVEYNSEAIGEMLNNPYAGAVLAEEIRKYFSMCNGSE